MPSVVPVVAACIVRPEKNQVLLAQRDQPEIPEAHLKWELPGGKINFCELPDEAVVREISEELGCSVRVVGLLPHIQTNLWEYLGQTRHFLILAFECRLAAKSQPEPRQAATGRVSWFHIDQIDWSTTLPGTREFIHCLSERPRGTTSTVYVRLERHDRAGQRTHFYELYQTSSLEGAGTQIHERIATLSKPTPAEHTGDFRFSYQAALQVMRNKLRRRLRAGYVVKASEPEFDLLRVALGL